MRIILVLALLLLINAAYAQSDTTVIPPDEPGRLSFEPNLLTRIAAVSDQVEEKANTLVTHAMGFLGVRYRRGGSSEATGFDCSGFVRAVYDQTAGLILPRSSYGQAAVAEKIDKTDMKPGDLVFFNTMRHAFSHVGIYVGDGKFIHSPRTGGVVRVESLSLPYWARRFDGARRVPVEATAANSTP